MTPEQRHRCMAAVKGTDTRPEMLVRRYLHARGFRYGLHNRKLPGSPDLVFRSIRTVVFVNGCFWHGHENCKYHRIPKSNSAFWSNKINRNRERDAAVQAALEAKGWNVIIIWECDLKNKDRREKILDELARRLLYIRCGYYTSIPHQVAEVSEPEVPYGLDRDI